MHTSPAYAEDVYVGALNGVKIGEHNASFIVPVADPGVTTVCRKIAPRHPNRFVSPLSSRFDELDGQMWLENVFIPWERVFLVEPSPEPIATWLLCHHLYGWLAKAEFTLGLALALTDAMGLKEHDQTVEYLVDLIADVQTAWDHVSAGLDGRESAFELHASGGVPAWRGRLRQRFPSYNELANAVLRAIDTPMPQIDVSNIPAAPLAPRRVVAAPAATPP